MITLAQIKAARALLDWTQEALARASGLSLPGINNMERGISSPRKESLVAIEQALVNAGIEFIGQTGVSLAAPPVQVEVIEGPNWLGRYDEDIRSALQSKDDEILQFSCNERQWMVHGSTTNHQYIDHRNKVGFGERILVPQSCDYVSNRREAYRTLPDAQFAELSYQIYADRFALILWSSQKIVLTRSKVIADGQRAQFNLLWSQGKPFSDSLWKTVERWEYAVKPSK